MNASNTPISVLSYVLTNYNDNHMSEYIIHMLNAMYELNLTKWARDFDNPYGFIIGGGDNLELILNHVQVYSDGHSDASASYCVGVCQDCLKLYVTCA